ncbi:hypothetical protein D9M72_544600 [compost metagenome]
MALMAGMYRPARSKAEPMREMRTCPLCLPDSCNRGFRPAKATTARALSKRETSPNSASNKAAVLSLIPSMLTSRSRLPRRSSSSSICWRISFKTSSIRRSTCTITERTDSLTLISAVSSRLLSIW